MKSFWKVLFFLACLVPAPLLFGGPLLSQQQSASVVTTNTFVVVQGSTLWDLAGEKCGNATRWQEIYDLNPYLAVDGRLTTNYEGMTIVRIFPNELLSLPSEGCGQPSNIVTPVETTPTEAATPVAMGVLQTPNVADSGTNWWFWLLLIAAAGVILLIADNRRLRSLVAGLQARVGSLEKYIADLRQEYEQRLEEQRTIDFAARRSNMPPLPDDVEDGVMTGPPVRFEGVTEENRDNVLDNAARAAYRQLHQGANMYGLVFERRNVRHVLVSSRPGETFMMTFGDDESRPVTLVREPGWIFDAVIRRGEEIIQELEGICVLGFCANAFEYRRSWIVGAHVEPYEYAAVHSAPDWDRVETERAARRVTVRSQGDKVVASIGDQPIVEGDYVILDTADDIAPENGAVAIGARTRLIAGSTEPVETQPEVEPESVADEVTDSEPVAEGAATTSTPE